MAFFNKNDDNCECYLSDFFDSELLEEINRRGRYNVLKIPRIDNIVQENTHNLYLEYCRRGDNMNKLLEFLENNTP